MYWFSVKIKNHTQSRHTGNIVSYTIKSEENLWDGDGAEVLLQERNAL